MVGWYLTYQSQIDFWFSGLGATPSQQCSDYYEKESQSLSDCNLAGPGSFVDRYMLRDKAPHYFNTYWKQNVQSWIIWCWVGGPFALFLLFYSLRWITAGFRTPPKEGAG